MTSVIEDVTCDLLELVVVYSVCDYTCILLFSLHCDNTIKLLSDHDHCIVVLVLLVFE